MIRSFILAGFSSGFLIFSGESFANEVLLESPRTSIYEREEYNPALRNKTGTKGDVTAEDVNTSTNRAPSTDHEVIEGAALSNEGVTPESVYRKVQREAQEEKILEDQNEFDEWEDEILESEGDEINPFVPTWD